MQQLRSNMSLLFVIIFLANCKPEKAPKLNKTAKDFNTLTKYTAKQDSIIEKYLKNGAWRHSYYSPEWQNKINEGLKVDSTIAYLWQQKAMPLFKQGKYEIGMPYIDKAVKFDAARWQDYRAFIKCIFAKTYTAAITDFQDCKKKFGNSYVMDHTYDFYIGLSYLQLNEFKKAEKFLKSVYEIQKTEREKGWMHPVDIFYYGISQYELQHYEKAIKLFDHALELYPKFSDVKYYKAKCLAKIGFEEKANTLMEAAINNGKKGYSFNEDNAVYERYPYQIRWHQFDY